MAHPKLHDEVVKEVKVIRVTAAGKVADYISRALRIFKAMETNLTVTATGKAVAKAVTTVKIIKRRFKGLHQITKITNKEMVDELEALDDSGTVTERRIVASIEIKLSKEPLDKSSVGFQEPLDVSLVKEGHLDEMTEPCSSSKGLGGKGHGRGKCKGKGDGKGSKRCEGKGKGKGKDKGKGNGKADDPEAKGKGKDPEGPAVECSGLEEFRQMPATREAELEAVKAAAGSQRLESQQLKAELEVSRVAKAAVEAQLERALSTVEEAHQDRERAQMQLEDVRASRAADQAKIEQLSTALQSIREECTCPILGTGSRDFVVAACGHSFDRQAVQHWFRDCRERGLRPTSPMTRAVLPHGGLAPNWVAKKITDILRQLGAPYAPPEPDAEQVPPVVGHDAAPEATEAARGAEGDILSALEAHLRNNPMVANFMNRLEAQGPPVFYLDMEQYLLADYVVDAAVHRDEPGYVRFVQAGALMDVRMNRQDAETLGWESNGQEALRLLPGAGAVHVAAFLGWSEACQLSLRAPGGLRASRSAVEVEFQDRAGSRLFSAAQLLAWRLGCDERDPRVTAVFGNV